MSIQSFFVRLSVKAAAVAAFAWTGASASAADVTVPAAPAAPAVVGAPVSVGDSDCTSCQHGAIRAKWSSLGWERGRLGYPTTDEYAVAAGRRNGFQHGTITWVAATGALQVVYR